MAVRDWLSKIKGGDDDRHPLASERGIKEFLQGLPESQPAISLDQGFDALESMPAAKLEAPLMLRALRAVDEHLQHAVAEQWHTLFRDTRGDQVSDMSLGALNQYYQRAALAYAAALDALPREAAKDVQEHAAVLACRGMSALVHRKKLLHVGYRTPDTALWETINRIYARARGLGVLRNRVAVYGGAGEQTSAANEHLLGLMFEVAPLGNLMPTQMQCLDALLRQLAAGFVSGEQHSAASPFYVELAKAAPPQRWLEGLKARGALLFFGLGAAYAKIQALAEQAAVASEVPDWAVPSDCDLEGYRKLLAMCIEHWSEKPPQRRHKRLAGGDEIVVVHSFTQTRRMVAASEFAKTAAERGFTGFQSDGDKLRDAKYFNRMRFGSVNPDRTQTGKLKKEALLPPKKLLEKIELEGDRQLMQRWKVADMSDSGIGAVPPSTASWAKLGVLLGYRLPDSMDWLVAVIRRLGRTSDNKLSVGLERVNGEALSVRVLPIRNAERATWENLPIGGEGTEEAILITGPANLLLLPPARYAVGQHYLIWASSERYPVQLTAVYPAGKDYQLVAFSKAG